MPDPARPPELPLDAFLAQQQVSTWDLLLFGDGSGLSWDLGGGFATFIVDRRYARRFHVVGARSMTTVNRMELSAYVEALAFHYGEILTAADERPYVTHIFSDSELTVKAGKGLSIRRANADLWQAFTWFEMQGYRFNWHWVPRNSTPFHELADALAGKARLAIQALRVSDARLYELMPYYGTAAAAQPVLPLCPSCKTPLAKIGEPCPICGAGKE